MFKLRIQIRRDLLGKDFWDSYKVWDFHEEVLVRVDSNNIYNGEDEDSSVEEDDIVEMIHDACGYTDKENMNNIQKDNEEPNVHAKIFTNCWKMLR